KSGGSERKSHIVSRDGFKRITGANPPRPGTSQLRTPSFGGPSFRRAAGAPPRRNARPWHAALFGGALRYAVLHAPGRRAIKRARSDCQPKSERQEDEANEGHRCADIDPGFVGLAVPRKMDELPYHAGADRHPNADPNEIAQREVRECGHRLG